MTNNANPVIPAKRLFLAGRNVRTGANQPVTICPVAT